MARYKRDGVHIDDNFDISRCADGFAAVDVVLTAVITCDGLTRYDKLSVVVAGCVPMSVDGGVGIHGLKD